MFHLLLLLLRPLRCVPSGRGGPNASRAEDLGVRARPAAEAATRALLTWPESGEGPQSVSWMQNSGPSLPGLGLGWPPLLLSVASTDSVLLEREDSLVFQAVLGHPVRLEALLWEMHPGVRLARSSLLAPLSLL